MNLSDPITGLSGVGSRYTQLLRQLGIKTVEDFLMHVPYRYEDHSNVKKITELTAGESATVIGEIIKIDNIFTRNGKRLTKGVLKDETGQLDLVWFNQHYIKQTLAAGSAISVSGTLDQAKSKPQFISPDWELIKNGQTLHTFGIVPIYSATEGVTAKWIRGKIKQILNDITIDELISKDIAISNGLIDRFIAFHDIHFPKSYKDIEVARERLSFEELMFIHLRGMKLRTNWKKKSNSHKILYSDKELGEFINKLPFELTGAQKKVISEILADLRKEVPMNRLLQGDVGSGKTVVAAAAISAAASSNFNTIYLAPTQILAKQHFASLQPLLTSDIKIGLVTAENKPPKNLKSSSLIIGTHAILHHLEAFSNIGLIIIDEQHKFGVGQRTQAIDYYTSKKVPNLLTITATPIPRSLALTFYGELDLSVIDELPKNRKQVKTWVVPESKRIAIYGWIKKQIDQHKIQVFVVCPFIEKSIVENLDNVKAATSEFDKLKRYFPNNRLGLLHGKLKSPEKDKTISDFSSGKIDILIATPVIEVGVNIPNANIILIETPERFGLASLHQLRGRVGRGDKQGYCILIPSTDSYHSLKRLKHMEDIYDGNKLAEIDLKIRGPGDIYGTEQHGYLSLKVADITNVEMIQKTKIVALQIFKNIDQYEQIKKKLDTITNVGDN